MSCQHLSTIIFTIMVLLPTVKAKNEAPTVKAKKVEPEHVIIRNESTTIIRDSKQSFDYAITPPTVQVCLDIFQVGFNDFSGLAVMQYLDGRVECGFVWSFKKTTLYPNNDQDLKCTAYYRKSIKNASGQKNAPSQRTNGSCKGPLDCSYGTQCVGNKCSRKPGILQNIEHVPYRETMTRKTSAKECAKQFPKTNYPLFTYDAPKGQCTHSAGASVYRYKVGAETGLI